MATAQASSSGGTYAYITNDDGTVSIIDTATDTVAKTVQLGNDPYGIAITPDGTTAYVADNKDNKVYVIDTSTKQVKTSIPVGNSPYGIAITPDGTKVYVANSKDNTVSIIDTAKNNAMTTVSGFNAPFGIAIFGTNAYITDSGGSTVSIIDTTTNKVMDPITGLSYPGGIAISPTGTQAYVSSGHANVVYIIDTKTKNIVTLPVENNPHGVTVSPDGTKVYVANFGSNSVSIIDTTTKTIINTVQVGNNPYGISVTPDGTKVYVANHGTDSDPGNTVSVINTATYKTTTVEVGNHPKAFGQFISTTPPSTSTDSNSGQVINSPNNTYSNTYNNITINNNSKIVSGSNYGIIDQSDKKENNTEQYSVGQTGNTTKQTGSTTKQTGNTVEQTETSLTSSTNQYEIGQPLTLIAIVSTISQGNEKPSGTVIFMDGATVIGNKNVISGQATFTTSAIQTGPHSITAKYNGDNNFKSSVSNAFALVINPKNWVQIIITFVSKNFLIIITSLIAIVLGDIIAEKRHKKKKGK
jgi:40-residue YVTN family beta-propeller repeat